MITQAFMKNITDFWKSQGLNKGSHAKQGDGFWLFSSPKDHRAKRR